MSDELPPGWTVTTLGTVGRWGSGGTPKTSDRSYYGGSIPWVKSGDLNDGQLFETEDKITEAGLANSAARLLEPGALLIALYGATIGRVAVNQIACATNQAVANCAPHAHVTSTDYLFWFALASRAALRELGQGGAQPNISQAILKVFPIPLPPLPEQRRIVARIEALNARTRRARADLERIAPLVEKHRTAMLRSALRGDLTAAWRQRTERVEAADVLLRKTPRPEQPRGGREATDEVIPGNAALSVNHPMTEPPQGWAWVPLLRIARQESGHTPSRGVAAYWNGDVPWIGIRDAGAHHGGVILDTIQHVTPLGIENSSARLLPAQTVCLSRTASVGYVTVMGRSMATSQDFVAWTCSTALLPDFLKYALLAEGDDIRRFGKGSTHTTIYFPEIRALHICLPPLAEQREIVRLLDAGLPSTRKADREAFRALALLDRLEQSILTRAFRGELAEQDTTDEPAAALLARLVGTAPNSTQRRGRAA